MGQGITLNIDADATGANKVFDSLNSRAVSTADSMSKAFSNCGQQLQQSFSAFDLTAISAAGKLLADGIESAFGKIKQIGTEIYQTTEYMQSLEMSVKSIVAADGIKTGKYQDYDEAIQNAAKDTEELFAWFKQLSLVSPYEYTDVVEAFKTNANMGESVETAKKVTTAILQLGSGLGLTTPQMKGFSVALAQTAATGRISAMDLRQFANNGFGMDKILSVFNAIGDKYGIVINDQNDFNNAIKEGRITTDDFFDALANFAETNYGGAVEAMASTIAGLKASLGDIKTNAINDLFLEASKTISTTLKPYVEYLMELLTSGQFTEWGTSVNEWVQGIMEPFQKIGATLESGQFMDGMREAISYITGQTDSLYDVVDLLNTLGEGDNEFIDTWMERLEAVRNFVNFIKENKDTIIAAFKGIGAAIAFALTVNTVEKFISAILALMNPVTALIALGAALGIAYQKNLGGIQEKAAVVKDYLMSLHTAFQEGGLSGVFDKLKEDISSISFEGILSKLGELKEQVKAKLSDMFNIPISVFDNIEGIVTGLLPVVAGITVIGKVTAGLVSAVSAVNGIVSGISGIAGIITGLMQCAPFVEGLVQSIAMAAQGVTVFGAVAAAVALVADGFRRLTEIGAIDWGGIFGGIKDSVMNTIGTIWESITDKVLPKLNELGQKLKESFSEISDVLSPIAVVLAGAVGTVGALVLSLVNGIIANVGNVIAFIVDGVTLIVDIISLPFTVLRGLWDMFMGVLEGSPERIKAGLDRIVQGFLDIGTDVDNLISDIEEIFTTFVETAWETLTTIFNAVDLGAIWDGFEAGFDRVRDNLETKWEKFKSSLRTDWNNLIDWATGKGDSKNASPYAWDKDESGAGEQTDTSSSQKESGRIPIPDSARHGGSAGELYSQSEKEKSDNEKELPYGWAKWMTGDKKQDIATVTDMAKSALSVLERQSYGQFNLDSLKDISSLKTKDEMWAALEASEIPDYIKEMLLSLQSLGMSTRETRAIFEDIGVFASEIDKHTAATAENTEGLGANKTKSTDSLISSSYEHYLDGFTTTLKLKTEELGDEELAKQELGIMSEEEYQSYIMPDTINGVDSPQFLNTLYTGMGNQLGMQLDSFNDVTVDNAEEAKAWMTSFDSWNDIYKGFTQGRIDTDYIQNELPGVLAGMGFSGDIVQSNMDAINAAIASSETQEQMIASVIFALTGINSEVATFKTTNKDQLDEINNTVNDIDAGGSGGSTTASTTTTQGAGKAAYVDNLNAALDEYQNAETDEEKWRAQSKISGIVAGTQLADGTYIGNVDDAFAITTQLINEGGNGKTALDLQSRYAGYSANVGNYTVQANEAWRQRQIEYRNNAYGAYEGLDQYGNPNALTATGTEKEEEGGLDKLFSQETLAAMQDFANAGGVALLFSGIDEEKVALLNSIGGSFETIAGALETMSELNFDLAEFVPKLDEEVVESWGLFSGYASTLADAVTTIQKVFTGQAEGAGEGEGGGEGAAQTGLMDLFTPITDETLESWLLLAEYAGSVAGSFSALFNLMNPDNEDGSLQSVMSDFVDFLTDDDGFNNVIKEFGDTTQQEVVVPWGQAYEYIKGVKAVMNELINMWAGSLWEMAVGKYVEVTGSAIGVTKQLASAANSLASAFQAVAAAIQAACAALARWQSMGGGTVKGAVSKAPNTNPVLYAAHGGTINGLAIVGERGPELISTSRNLNVFTNNTLMSEIAQARASLNNMSATANAITPSYLSGGGNTYDNSSHNDFSFGNIYGEDYLRDFVKEVFTDEVEKAKFLGRK